ncbi:endolysin [Vulcanococcus sp.]|uniref:endolysin n=1 Tax=Vulcanococcus sp. TaxID=2856995 RepID=UPI0037DA7266
MAGCCVAGPLLQAPAQAQLMAAAGTEAGSAASTTTTLDAPRPHSQLALLNASDGSPAEGQPFRFAITPERRALLNTIRYAEGTWARGENLGYRIMFGGGLMPHLERHPDRVIYSGGYASAAAGAYQFMPFTWARASRSLQLPGFGPDVQDQAAIFLIQRRGALPLADQGAFTPELAARLAPEWASFPTLAGRSFYGQPVKRYGALKAFYERNLAELRAIAGMVPVVAELPSCEPADSLRCRLERLDRLGPRSVAQSR